MAHINHKTNNLSQRVARGGVWIFLLKLGRKIFGILRLIIIGRILHPSDFGLMGIALLTLAAIQTISQTGYQSALVQRKESLEGYLDTVWTVLILRGFLLFVSVYVIAPWIGVFFANEKVIPIIRFLGFSVFLQSFGNIGLVYFTRKLTFHKIFIYHFIGTFVNFVVAVSTAILLKNVWALVLGLFAEKIVSLVLSYSLHPYRPHLHLNVKKARELFHFGKWVLGAKTLIFLGEHLDDLLVGRMINATALGFYQMGYRISNMLETEITQVVSSVTFPGYALLQDHQEKLNKAYFKVLKLVTTLSIPMAVGIYILASEFTLVFLGEKWLLMVPAMQFLAIAGFIKSLTATGSPLFIGTGYPRYDFYMQLVRGIFIMIVIYPFIQLQGIRGASLAVVISVAGMLIVWLPMSRKMTGARYGQYLHSFGPPFISAGLMFGFIKVAKVYWQPMPGQLLNNICHFSLLVFLSILVYGLGLLFSQRFFPRYDLEGELRYLRESLFLQHNRHNDNADTN